MEVSSVAVVLVQYFFLISSCNDCLVFLGVLSEVSNTALFHPVLGSLLVSSIACAINVLSLIGGHFFETILLH